MQFEAPEMARRHRRQWGMLMLGFALLVGLLAVQLGWQR